MKKIMAVLVALLLILPVSTVQAAHARTTTWHVYPGQSIQTVLDSAGARDTIIVHTGVYHQSVIIKKSISLLGDGAILDGTQPADDRTDLTSDAITIAGGVSGVTIKRLEIRNYLNGIDASDGDTKNVKITNNVIHDTETAINVGNEGAGLHQDWFIAQNTLLNNAYGIHLSGESSVISNNIVKQFITYGIYVQGDGIAISKNTVQESNGYFAAIFVGRTGEDKRDSQHITVMGNVVTSVTTGVLLMTVAKEAQLNDVKIISNKVSLCGGDGIVVKKFASHSGPITNVIISYNTLRDNIGAGIIVQGVTQGQVSANSLTNHMHSGIILIDSNTITVAGNVVRNSSYDGIEINSSNDNTVVGNTVSGNNWGIVLLQGAGGTPPNGNVIMSNTAKGNFAYDLYWDGTGTDNVWKLNRYDTKNW